MKKTLHRLPPFEKWPDWVILVLFFTYSLAIGLLIQFILLPYVFPSWHAGEGLLIGLDSRAFHRQAAELANRIITDGWQVWEITPQPVAGIAAIFYALLAPHPWIMLPINSFLHALAAWVLYKTLRFFLEKRIHAFLAALPLLLFPSALSWVAQMHNDNYSVAGAVLMLYAWVCFTRKESWNNFRLILGGLLSIIAGVALTWLVRDYVVSMYTGIGAVLLLICLIVFIVRWRRSEWSWQRTLVACGVVGFAFFLVASFQIFNLGSSSVVIEQDYLQQLEEDPISAYPRPADGDLPSDLKPGDPGFKVYMLWQESPWLPSWIDYQLEQLSIKRFKAIRSTWTETRGGSNIDTDIAFRNAYQIIRYLPRAAEIGLLSPFPQDWFGQGSKAPNTMMRRVSGLEMTFTYLCWIGLLAAIWTWRKRPEFWVMLFFCIGMVIIYTLGTPNVGTLYRLRYPVFMSLVGFGLAGWVMIFQKIKARTKKSSHPQPG